jgi:hypothetical protein
VTSDPHQPIVVVSGLPRSGTSMMMRMLEAGGIPVIADGIRKPDADNPEGYYEYEPVKALKSDSSWLEDAGGRVVKIIYLLLRDLPNAYQYDVIFMRRAVEEVVASQDEMLRHGGASPDSEESMRLVTMFRNEVRVAEEWLASRPNFRVLYVEYREVIDHPRTVCSAIGSFLSFDLNQQAMESVVSPALYRQRRDHCSFSAAD